MRAIVFFLCLTTCTTAGVMLPVNDVACKTGGRRVPDGAIPTPEDLAKDAFCAQRVIDRAAPHGVVTIFGSARAKEDWDSYKITRKFAYLWSKENSRYPILTGGGPGLMEAGNRGAKEAGAPSLYFSTYFGSGSEKPNSYTTDGFMFASFAQREADMVDRAAAVVIGQGGVGTEWEIFETLSKVQTRKKARCPIVLLGKRSDWASLFARMDAMKQSRTVSPGDSDLMVVAETPEEAVAIIRAGIRDL
ncbi:MAG TPA: LOG family protein [Leptospiraceae bacterium]|nr:LOG family protein [Leptospirales bacterium]HMX57238.1 LOG family protein [Leptospiraceae bacterium]HNE25286.1 LOG family protein [Leptospiraceae bacterium]HNJ02900.1 LOG family protein [Leptospiraceae bacterium]HNJ33378.1 LOG family protein [Leptospiraceae bacterium]